MDEVVEWKIVFTSFQALLVLGKAQSVRSWPILLRKSAVIEGDMIYLMIKGGLVAPWEDDGYYMDLFWDNIISLINNFIDRGITVVIEYVIFEEQLKKIATFLKEKTKSV